MSRTLAAITVAGITVAALVAAPSGAAMARSEKVLTWDLGTLFPTAVRYTGASLSFNLAGILGASLAPYIATLLAGKYGVAYVGYYLSAAAVLTLVALLLSPQKQA